MLVGLVNKVTGVTEIPVLGDVTAEFSQAGKGLAHRH